MHTIEVDRSRFDPYNLVVMSIYFEVPCSPEHQKNMSEVVKEYNTSSLGSSLKPLYGIQQIQKDGVVTLEFRQLQPETRERPTIGHFNGLLSRLGIDQIPVATDDGPAATIAPAMIATSSDGVRQRAAAK